MRKFIAAVLCLFAPIAAIAGSAASGKVHYVIVGRDGSVLFWTTSPHVGNPGCASDERWVIHPNSQAMIKALMAAHASGKNVIIEGTGSCITGGEQVQFLHLPEAPSAPD